MPALKMLDSCSSPFPEKEAKGLGTGHIAWYPLAPSGRGGALSQHPCILAGAGKSCMATAEGLLY